MIVPPTVHQEKDDVFYARPRQRPNHYQLSLNERRFLSSLLSLKVEFLVELLTKVREDFTITEKALTSIFTFKTLC